MFIKVVSQALRPLWSQHSPASELALARLRDLAQLSIVGGSHPPLACSVSVFSCAAIPSLLYRAGFVCLGGRAKG